VFAVTEAHEPVRRPRIAHSKFWSPEIPARNVYFTGRSTELAELQSHLLGSQVGVLSQPPLALYGLGGIGKTEIAVEYAHTHAGEYDIVWWVRAESEDRIRDALVKLGKRLDLSDAEGRRNESIDAVLDALRTGRYERWLLIFDNASDPAVIQTYLPMGPPQGHVIITSREREWRRNTRADGIEVSPFEPDETIAFLRKRVPDLALLQGTLDEAGREEDQRRHDEAAKLAMALDNLPLAAEHAAAYLVETNISAEAYLKMYEENAHELMSEHVDIDYPHPVATTWSISTRKLSTDALELFHLCAFFSPEPIAEDLFLGGGRSVEALTELREVLVDKQRFRLAARELHRLSLAKIDGRRNVLQVHRVVQWVTQGQVRIDRPESVDEYRAAVHALLAASDPGYPDRETNDVLYDRSLQHLRPSGAVHTADPELQKLIINQVRRLHLRGGHQEALYLGEEALEVWRGTLGEADLKVLELAVEVVIAMRLAGRGRAARALNRQTLELLREHHGPDNQITLVCANSYGGDLRALGKFQEAYELDQDLLPRFQQVFLPEHERTLNVLNNLGADHRRLGDFKEALKCDEETYAIRYRLGPSDTRTLASKDAAAQDLRRCGLYEESLEVARAVVDALDDGRRSANNADVLNAQKGLGVALRRAGHHLDALEQSREAYELYAASSMGPAHRYTLRAAVNLTNDLRATGDLRAAEELGRQTLEHCETVDDPTSDITYAAQVALAVVLRGQSPTEARSLDERAVRGLTELYGAEHPFTLAAATNLASDLTAAGEPAAARDLGERTLESSRRMRGADHPYSLAAAANLSLDLRATGDDARAEELRAETLHQFKETLTTGHPASRAAEQRARINVDIEPF
jgi:tetratricopeptide (TPR) repeat protein